MKMNTRCSRVSRLLSYPSFYKFKLVLQITTSLFSFNWLVSLNELFYDYELVLILKLNTNKIMAQNLNRNGSFVERRKMYVEFRIFRSYS
jgi:hypothetical protein